ncbi:MAG: protein translocase subunit SecD [Acidobacteria bacterium]|nr:protein translocase subunit SecD [Acidobacteriota bacterium]
MDKKLLWRIVLIVAVLVVSIVGLYPPAQKIHLGLDLRGGIHLVLRVNTGDAIKAELDNASQLLISQAEAKGIKLGDPKIEPKALRFVVPVPLNVNRDALRQIIKDNLAQYKWSSGVGEWTFTLPKNIARRMRDRAVKEALNTIRNRVDQFGVSEPRIQRQGIEGDRILVQLPGVDDPGRVKDLIGRTALLELKEVIAGPASSRQALLAKTGGQVPPDAEVLTGDQKDIDGNVIGKEYYLVRRAAIVSGRELRSARRSQDQYGQPAVQFTLVPSAAHKFAQFTGSHIGTNLAIVLDNKVMSAPVIHGQISDQGIIQGSFSVQEAEDLALVLRAGALPASITYLEERTVGPSLGHDSVVRGIRAGISGLIIVIVFMLVYYKWSGLNADVALLMNLVLLMGAMAYFGATLTLPGIAGVILTIGMAVDANVLIFERVREELALGKTVRSALDAGFSRAFGTILDANLTTLIAALFLFQFGTGPVKGFAVTLSIGILASMFTAVFVSRTLYMIVLAKKDRVESLSI